MSHTAPTSPWWLQTRDIRRFPVLSSDQQADVVVVGCGIVGTLTAWRCAQSGAKVILVEKNHVGTGDTGFSTAFALRVPDASLSELYKKMGPEAWRILWSELTSGQQDLRRLAQQLHHTSWVDVPGMYGAFTAQDSTLAQEWAVVREVEPTAEFVRGDAAAPFVEAIRFPNEARLNPRAFVIDILQHAPANLRVFEETGVISITAGSPVKIETAHGRLTAKKVIVATGSVSELLPEYQPQLEVSVSYVMTDRYATRCPVPDAVCWDTSQPYHYFRHLDDQTLMLGGADQVVDDHRTQPEEAWRTLGKFRDDHFGAPTKTEQRWFGTLFETPDSLPIIGAVPGSPNVLVATGFSGNGMVMGAVASRWLAAEVAGQTHPLKQIVSPSRPAVYKPHQTTKMSVKTGNQPRATKIWLGLIAVIVGLAAIAVPTIVFWLGHHGQTLGEAKNLVEFSQHLFPLIGLYAFTLVWAQIILGSLTPIWRKFWPRVTHLHRWLGIFTLLFALLHPLLLLIGVGWTVYWARTFVAPNLTVYIWFGYFQLLIIIVTSSTALLMRIRWLQKHWRTIHLLNYLVFYSVLIHSLALGHDLQVSPVLRGLWYAYGLTVTVAIGLRLARRRQVGQAVTPRESQADLGPLEDFPDGRMKKVTVGTQAIVVIRSGQQFWAMENRCSHAGGPLCEGVLDGQTITCPWHGSKFSTTTGAVVRGPATTPQRTYPIEVKRGRVTITVHSAVSS